MGLLKNVTSGNGLSGNRLSGNGLSGVGLWRGPWVEVVLLPSLRGMDQREWPKESATSGNGLSGNGLSGIGLSNDRRLKVHTRHMQPQPAREGAA